MDNCSKSESHANSLIYKKSTELITSSFFEVVFQMNMRYCQSSKESVCNNHFKTVLVPA